MCAVYGNAVYGNAVDGNAVYGNAVYGHAVYGNAVDGNAVYGYDLGRSKRAAFLCVCCLLYISPTSRDR